MGQALIAWAGMCLAVVAIFLVVCRTSKPGAWTMPAYVPPPPGPADRHWLSGAGDDLEGRIKQEMAKNRAMYAKMRPKVVITPGDAAMVSHRPLPRMQDRIEVTRMEDDRPRFIKTGKVINRFRPLARRRIGVIPKRC